MNTIDKFALVFIGGLLATMPLFIITGSVRDADLAGRGRSILLGSWLRHWFMWTMGPIERVVVRARISPDVFSWLSALLGLGAGMAFALGELSAAGWLILLGGAADNLDGRIARARGVSGAYGAFLDSTLDRFSETFTFFGLIAFFAPAPWRSLSAAGALAGSMLVSYARARGEALGVNNAAGLMQRAERLVLLALSALLDPLGASRLWWHKGAFLAGTTTVVAAGAFGTAVYRTIVIASALSTRLAPCRNEASKRRGAP